MNTNSYETEIVLVETVAAELQIALKAALTQPFTNFSALSSQKKPGLYIVNLGSQVIYIGKTTRSGKIRMREMAADFRSHTLNRKLLTSELKNVGIELKALNSKSKQSLIELNQLSEYDFKSLQEKVNQKVRSEMSFRFYPVHDQSFLTRLEHYAISILNPSLND